MTFRSKLFYSVMIHVAGIITPIPFISSYAMAESKRFGPGEVATGMEETVTTRTKMYTSQGRPSPGQPYDAARLLHMAAQKGYVIARTTKPVALRQKPAGKVVGRLRQGAPLLIKAGRNWSKVINHRGRYIPSTAMIITAHPL